VQEREDGDRAQRGPSEGSPIPQYGWQFAPDPVVSPAGDGLTDISAPHLLSATGRRT